MSRFRCSPRHARVRACATALAAVTVVMAAACFPDGPIDVDQTTVVVQVRDAANNPVAGAQVTWWPAGLSESQAQSAGDTGATGNVTFDVMTVWDDVRIRVSPPAGFAAAESQPNPMDAALLPSLTTVTFRVVAD